MRIASICSHYPSPGNPVRGVFVQRRLAALAKLADVHVYSPRPWFPALRPREPLARENETPAVERVPMFYVPRFFKGYDGHWLERALYPALREPAARGQIDVIDAHFEYPEGVGAVRLARRLGLPAFITLRGLLPKCLSLPSHRPPVLRALAAADGLIAVSHSLRDVAVRQGIDPDKIAVVPNAVDTSVYCPRQRDEVRQRLGIAAGVPLIVSVGHVVPSKGFVDLVGAFARLRTRFPRARLAIVGATAIDRPHSRELADLIHAVGLEAECVLVGQKSAEAVAQWLNAADVFALATKTEGCCNAVLESLACGTPVVTTPVGDNPRYIAPGVNGLLTPVGNVERLADAMAEALLHAWDRERISATVSSRNWDDVAHEVLGFFAERMPRACRERREVAV